MSKLRFRGSTSGYTEIQASAVAGDNTITLPTTSNGTILTADSSGNVNIDSGTLYVDATNNRVGLGTSTPSAVLDVSGNSKTSTLQIGTNPAGISVACLGIPNQKRIYGRNAANTGDVNILYIDGSNGMVFGPGDAAVIDSSGRLGIGSTTGFVERLHVNGNIRTDANDTGLFFNSSTTAITGNGTSSYIAFNTSNAEKARLDSSGRFLVGTSSTSSVTRLVVQGNSGDATGAGSIRITRGSSNPANGDSLGYLVFTDSGHTPAAWVVSERDGGTWTSGSSQPTRLGFSTTADGASSPTERMRLDSLGRLSLNTTAAYGGITLDGKIGSTNSAFWVNVDNTSHYYLQFEYNKGGRIGSINTNGTSVAFNTSSDYRLKENVVPLTGAVDRLNRLQVHRFNFIADPDKTVDGFIAHEAQAVVPECVTGTKDEVDDEGNPVYQGIDQSKLVPLLTAALQEALQKIEDLETRLTAAGA